MLAVSGELPRGFLIKAVRQYPSSLKDHLNLNGYINQINIIILNTSRYKYSPIKYLDWLNDSNL
jgi:hypothetical protein